MSLAEKSEGVRVLTFSLTTAGGKETKSECCLVSPELGESLRARMKNFKALCSHMKPLLQIRQGNVLRRKAQHRQQQQVRDCSKLGKAGRLDYKLDHF